MYNDNDYNEVLEKIRLSTKAPIEKSGPEYNVWYDTEKDICFGLDFTKENFFSKTSMVHTRQGKTYISNIIGQLICLVPNSHVLLMSPNYSLSQISFDLQRNLIKHFD